MGIDLPKKKNENKNTQNIQKRTKKALIQQTPWGQPSPLGNYILGKYEIHFVEVTNLSKDV